MKIIKYIFLLLLLLTGTISVFIATKEGNYTVEKKKIINIPKDIVFSYTTDSKNWGVINPWKQDKTKIKSIQKIDNETFIQNISINEIDSELRLTFKDTLSKKTIVTWNTKGRLSFKDKFLSIINRGTHNDFAEKFENGLTTINTILNTEVNSFNIKINGFVSRDTLFYIQRVIKCREEELPLEIKRYVPKLITLLKNTNTPKNGNPFVIYHTKDSIKSTITFSIAIPTKHKIYTSTESDIYTGQTNAFQAVKATLTGNYNHKKEAYTKLSEFMTKNRLERSEKNKLVEIIRINSSTEKSASKWVTEIYIPVKPKKTTITINSVRKDTINTIIESNFTNPSKT